MLVSKISNITSSSKNPWLLCRKSARSRGSSVGNLVKRFESAAHGEAKSRFGVGWDGFVFLWLTHPVPRNRNRGWTTPAFKGNQWVFISPDHKAGYFETGGSVGETPALNGFLVGDFLQIRWDPWDEFITMFHSPRFGRIFWGFGARRPWKDE